MACSRFRQVEVSTWAVMLLEVALSMTSNRLQSRGDDLFHVSGGSIAVRHQWCRHDLTYESTRMLIAN